MNLCVTSAAEKVKDGEKRKSPEGEKREGEESACRPHVFDESIMSDFLAEAGNSHVHAGKELKDTSVLS